jgi:uncharacterized membrane protein
VSGVKSLPNASLNIYECANRIFHSMKIIDRSAVVTASIGLAVSIYLSIVKLANKDVLCFEGMGDCQVVTNSAYSVWRGIPVAYLGVAGYIIILGLIFLKQRQKHESSSIMLALFGITTFGALYSLYLTYVELFIIHSVCPWCLASAIAMLLLFIYSASMLGKSKFLNNNH